MPFPISWPAKVQLVLFGGTDRSFTTRSIQSLGALTRAHCSHTGGALTVLEYVKEKGLLQISGEDELVALVDEIIAGNPAQLAQFHGGKSIERGIALGRGGGGLRSSRVWGCTRQNICSSLYTMLLGAP